MKEPYLIINGSLYNLGHDDVLHQCALPHECQSIINQAHAEAVGRHFQAETTIEKILQARLWWPTLNNDCKSQLQKYDKCQRIGRPLKYNEIPLVLVNPSLTFEIWAIYFVGPFPNLGQRTCARYIIINIEYVTKWAEVEPA